jgi:Zn-dependent protease with chaperone function
MDRKQFPGITAEAFVSDADRRALAALQKVPLLPELVKKFYEHGLDRWMYVYNMSRGVRLGPRQVPTVYEILRESCAILDMPEPELYLTSNPFANAFAGGVERPYIVLRSSMIETLTDDELFHLIGHELGHIKAGHVLYFSLAQLLLPLLEMIGRRTFGVGDALSYGLVMAMYEWSRQAEISADRAGLLVAQELNISLDANLKMCAGWSRLSGELNRDAFMDQARTYQDMDGWDSVAKVIWFMLMNWQSTHPMFVHRVQMLERWVQEGSYERIMAGNYPKVEAAS